MDRYSFYETEDEKGRAKEIKELANSMLGSFTPEEREIYTQIYIGITGDEQFVDGIFLQACEIVAQEFLGEGVHSRYYKHITDFHQRDDGTIEGIPYYNIEAVKKGVLEHAGRLAAELRDQRRPYVLAVNPDSRFTRGR